MRLTSLLGRHTTDQLGTVVKGLLAVEGAGLTSEALADNTRVLLHVNVLNGVLIAAAHRRRRQATRAS